LRVRWVGFSALFSALFIAACNQSCLADGVVHQPVEVESATLEKGNKSIRINFTNGQNVVVRVDNPEDNCETPDISQDRRSLLYVEDAFIDASYQVPASVSVYRDGKRVEFRDAEGKPSGECFSGAPLGWSFVASGQQFFISCAFEHGVPYEQRTLFDLSTGRMIGTVKVDNDTGKPPADAPAWAK